MYSWSGDTSTWYGSGRYTYREEGAKKRKVAAKREAEAGPRTYAQKASPDVSHTDPKKRIASQSTNPIVVAIDVTGSMSKWPAEIFDRLPLLYNTLSQYRPDLEIAFIAVGDESADSWPLQVTKFANGFDLETELGSLFGEGGGGDIPESYGLLAWYLANRVQVDGANRPFFLLFGDAPMHETVPRRVIEDLLGVDPGEDVDAIGAWQQVAQKWDAWFLRRPTGKPGDSTHQQWEQALGASRVVQIEDEARAVDCAMGIVARSWNFLDDFKQNLGARQSPEVVEKVAAWLERCAVDPQV